MSRVICIYIFKNDDDDDDDDGDDDDKDENDDDNDKISQFLQLYLWHSQ